jgi:hypothetical protein
MALYRVENASEPYVHRVRSGTDPLAFLAIETSHPRPARAPQAPLGRPSGCLLEADTFEFATAQSVKLRAGESVSIPYSLDTRPVARVLVCLAGPPLREIDVRSGTLAVDRVEERVEHGQRVGGIAVLHPLSCTETAAAGSTVSNNSGEEAFEGVVADIYAKLV